PACERPAPAAPAALAAADLDADRDRAAVPARAGRGARIAAAAAAAEPGQGAGLSGRPRRLGAVAGPARCLRRVRLVLVHRGLPAAVRLADRLPDPAHHGLCPGTAGQADPGTAAAEPAGR